MHPRRRTSAGRARARAVIAALFALLGALGLERAVAESPREVYEREIALRLDADEGLTRKERALWKKQILAAFAGAFEGLVTEREYMLEAVDTIFHVMIEGIFAELPPEQVVPVARAAFDARKGGAPAAAVEGIALYGLSDYVRDQGITLGAMEIATWASGSEAAKRVGIPDFIAQDFIAQALEGRWGAERYRVLNNALMKAVAEGNDAEVVGRYLLISVELGEKTDEEILAEMEPYLQRVRRERAEEKMKQQRMAPSKPKEKPTEPIRKPWEPVPGQYNPYGMGKSQPVPMTPRQGATAGSSPSKKSEPLMGFVPATRPPRQQTAAAPPPAERAPRGAPVSAHTVSAQANAIVGVVSRSQYNSEMRTWIGTPYKWGGTQKIYGADCSGFTQGSLKAVNLLIPRVSRDQAQVGRYLNANGAANLSYGDLVFFDTTGRGTRSQVSHVGVYVSGGDMIHASSSKGIMQTDFTRKYYQSKYMFGRRVTQFTR